MGSNFNEQFPIGSEDLFKNKKPPNINWAECGVRSERKIFFSDPSYCKRQEMVLLDDSSN
ncbi:hypothetical protein C7B70_07590 [Chlorogloea sp. CCALA 695]|nr:hypothetical protein C7B70_07590 [Chlorogloea sp. CCALA 695]